jgi:hypothetical protein
LATNEVWRVDMTSYTVPRRDMEFILEDVLDTGAHFQKIIGGEEWSW